jgi:hypothetical protein
MAVTVKKVFDPAKAARFFGPGKNKRLVAVQIVLKNTGSAVYSDSPGNGAELIDAQGQSYSENLIGNRSCQAFAQGSATVRPGDSRLGCLTFTVPKDTAIAGFQFTLDSGFGPETGEWNLS